MRICFSLATTGLAMSCLMFTCGCQNETAATNQSKPSQAAYVDPSEMLALTSEDQDGISSAAETAIDNGSLMLESRASFEYDPPGTLIGDMTEANASFKKALNE